MTKRGVIEIAAFFAAFALGMTTCASLLYKRSTGQGIVQIQRDTVVVRDTVRETMPVERVRYIRQSDTIRLTVHDTTVVTMPREVAEYADSNYRAQVSGVAPRLDWIEVYPVTRTVTQTQVRTVDAGKRWGIGINAGYGVQMHTGQVTIGPYIGIGVQYSLIQW